MEDRELLELAAKAAGVPIKFFNSIGEPVVGMPGGGPESCLVRIWNPLTDDGDALRLAARLRISVVFVGGVVDARYAGGVCHEAFGLAEPQPALIRRAIVRAAAALPEAEVTSA